MPRPFRSALVALLACGVGLAACDVREAVASPAPSAPAPAPAPAAQRPLRLGVVSFYSPRLMYLKYQPLVDYLARASGRPWELVLSRSYEEAETRLCRNEVDVAYLGPSTFLRARRACGAAAALCLRTGGSTTYESWIMVRGDSPIRALADLAGKTVGFGSPLSTSSHVVARQMLRAAGLAGGTDYVCRYFEHHEHGAESVLLGEADACAVRDLVGREFEKRGLRTIARSGPIPNFPFALAPGAPAGLGDELRRLLIDVPKGDAHVRGEIGGWDPELAGGFGACSAADFAPLARIEEDVFGPRALELGEKALRCDAVRK